ncbi:MAG: hypothetical protein D6835_05375, partial [Candidatus Thermofonsia bacterium]
MTAVFRIVLAVLAGITLLASLFFVLRAFGRRGRQHAAPYGVARQEAVHAMKVDLLWALAGVVLAGVVWAAYLLLPWGNDVATGMDANSGDAPVNFVEPQATVTPVEVMTLTPVPTAVPTQPPAANTPAPQETAVSNPTNTPEPAPTETPEATATPDQKTAVVTSGVGVWLRAEPGTESEQLEWVLEGSVLVVLDGEAQSDDYTWQRVRTPQGNEGWVATEFITFI